jgi:TatD DNase family protein
MENDEQKYTMDEVIKMGTEIGINVALEHMKKEREERKKGRYDRRLRNTKLLLREFRKLFIHSRDAAQDTYTIMKETHAEEAGGIIHCFSYGPSQAKLYLEKGFYLGIGGVVTFQNAKKLKEVVEYAPITQMVLETDSPYLSPVPNRGKRNTSLNIPYIAKEIAKIKNMDVETVIQITNENAKKIYFQKIG